MGSWFGTCGITQMPLVSDEIVMIPIKESLDGEVASDFCYANDRWEVCGFPVYGKYDDYGQMAMHTSEHMVWAINAMALQTKLIPHKDDDEYARLPKFDADDILDIDLFQEALHENAVKIRGHRFNEGSMVNAEVHISRMFILRKVWDDLIAKAFDTTYEGEARDLAFYRSKVIEYIDDEIASSGGYSQAINRALRRMNQRHLDGHDGRGFTFLKLSISSYISANKLTKIDDTLMLLADRYAQMVMIDNLMNSMRKHYGPQCGAGSQDNDYMPYQVLIAAMQSVIAENADDEWWYGTIWKQLDLFEQ